MRLHVTRTGAVKALEFTGGGPPPFVAQCLRKVATSWNFRDVELPSDVELFVPGEETLVEVARLAAAGIYDPQNHYLPRTPVTETT